MLDRNGEPDETQEPSLAFGDDEDDPRRPNWRRLNVLFFIGCAVAAVLFIVAASFVQGLTPDGAERSAAGGR